jgi:hypothetical protein
MVIATRESLGATLTGNGGTTLTAHASRKMEGARHARDFVPAAARRQNIPLLNPRSVPLATKSPRTNANAPSPAPVPVQPRSTFGADAQKMAAEMRAKNFAPAAPTAGPVPGGGVILNSLLRRAQ